ncbi:unnamed protein product [Effrenium voratum]|uniref:Uncharacterized protein n=1 Tax=Effrenium voratum TaxID=2562239 RepID=A0AA36MLE3_9DINO|nr:unnamed protein product [Effrenium voratum]
MGRVTTVVGSVASVTGVQGRGAKLDRRKMCRKAAFPFAAGILSGILCSTLKFMQTYVDDDNWIEENLVFDSTAYGSFGTCMSFMIVFRTAQSYSRYWEGIVAVYEIMGYLFNAASNCLAFARITKAEEMQVTNFKRLVVRLFSLLFCLVLRELEGSEVSSESALKFPVLDPRGIDQKTRAHLLNFKSHSRPEQVYQAISKVILDAQSSGVINTPPPIVGRIYQEMGLGMRTFQCAMKLAVVDFPAPYLLALKMMLVVHMLLTPVAVISWATTVAFSGFFCFVLVFTMFGLMQLAAELDNPFLDNGFGFDKMILQQKLNKALVTILLEEGRPVASLSQTAAILGSDDLEEMQRVLASQGVPH